MAANTVTVKVRDHHKSLRFSELITTGSIYSLTVEGATIPSGAMFLTCNVQGEEKLVAYATIASNAASLSTNTAELKDAMGNLPIGAMRSFSCVIHKDGANEYENVATGMVNISNAGGTWSDTTTGAAILFKGPKGDKGDTGSTGAQGPKGDKGDKGDPGSSANLDDNVTQQSSNGVKSSGIWTWVKGLLPNWLTSSFPQPITSHQDISGKRDNTDLVVYKQFSDWTSVPDVSGTWVLKWCADGWGICCPNETMPYSATKGDADSTELSWGEYEWAGGFQITFTRTGPGSYPTSDRLAKTSEIPQAMTAGTGISISNNTISTTAVRTFSSIGGTSASVSSGNANLSNFFGTSNSVLSSTINTKIANATTPVLATGTQIATIGGKAIYAPEGGGGSSGYKLWVFCSPSSEAQEDYIYVKIGNDTVFTGYPNITINGKSVGSAISSSGKTELLYCNGSVTGNVTVYSKYSYSDDRTQVYINGTRMSGRQTTFAISQDTVIYFSNIRSCLDVSTPIMMADGKSMPIGELRPGDMVMSLNPETMQLEPDEVTMADGDENKTADRKTVWRFDDGRTVTTMNRHRFYNADLGEFMYMEAWLKGEAAIKADGSATRLVSSEVIEGAARHATIFTRRFNNYFANGLLCGNRHSVPMAHKGMTA